MANARAIQLVEPVKLWDDGAERSHELIDTWTTLSFDMSIKKVQSMDMFSFCISQNAQGKSIALR